MLTLPLGNPRLPLGERAARARSAGLAGSSPGLPLRADGADPARVPGGRRSPSSLIAAVDPGQVGERGWARGSPGRCAARSRSWSRSSPGRSTTSSPSTAPSRSAPAAARRSTSAPCCPPTANTSGPRRCWSSATSAATSNRAPKRSKRRPDTALRPRRRTLSRPSARPGARQDRQGRLLQLLRRRPERVRGDDRSQGLADVERRRRRSDERDRRPGDPGLIVALGLGGLVAARPCAGAGGSWS